MDESAAMKPLLLLLPLLLALLLAGARCQRREVDELPDSDLRQQPNVHFSGYLNAQTDRRLFYWLSKAQEVPPAKAPLVLWLNGGPGCSSLGGLFTTNGPFTATDNGRLRRNPWSWNRVANMLYIETPVSVGFSHARSRMPPSDWNDANTTRDTLLALKHFNELFPELADSEFFVTGESYAGVYLPFLAEAILKENGSLARRLRGVAIGNGYFVGHDGMQAARLIFGAAIGVPNITDSDVVIFNSYNIAQDCHIDSNGFFHSYQCVNTSAMELYLNRDSVKRALGVVDGSPRYRICNATVSGRYALQNESMQSQLKLLAESGLRVLLYNGNLDYLLPFLGTAKFLAANFNWNGRYNGSWYFCKCRYGSVSRQLGGLVIQLPNGIQARSVNGAGHSVPADRPEAAFQLFKEFLEPETVPDCQLQSCPVDQSGATRLALCQLPLLLMLAQVVALLAMQ